MPRMMIRLTPANAEALYRLAVSERRDTRDQAAVIIERALAQTVPQEERKDGLST